MTDQIIRLIAEDAFSEMLFKQPTLLNDLSLKEWKKIFMASVRRGLLYATCHPEGIKQDTFHGSDTKKDYEFAAGHVFIDLCKGTLHFDIDGRRYDYYNKLIIFLSSKKMLVERVRKKSQDDIDKYFAECYGIKPQNVIIKNERIK